MAVHSLVLMCRSSSDSESSTEDTLGASLHPAVISGNLGQVVLLKNERSLTDHEKLKFHILTNHFTPDATYKFPSVPSGKQNRSFQ